MTVNFSQQLQDLQEVTQDVHYENYRSERLAKGVAVNRKTAVPTNSAAPTAAPEQISEKEKILQVVDTHTRLYIIAMEI